MKISVLFEYEVAGMVVRGVRDAEGNHRIERKRVASKKFRTVMWTGNNPSALNWYNSEDYRSDLQKKYPQKRITK